MTFMVGFMVGIPCGILFFVIGLAIMGNFER